MTEENFPANSWMKPRAYTGKMALLWSVLSTLLDGTLWLIVGTSMGVAEVAAIDGEDCKEMSSGEAG